MSKLSLALDLNELDLKRGLLVRRSAEAYSAFQDVFKKASGAQDNATSEKSAILNSTSSIALETKLNGQDGAVNLYDYTKTLALNAWQKTKNLISEAVPGSSITDQLKLLEQLQAKYQDLSVNEIINTDDPGLIKAIPFKHTSWRDSDRFKNSKDSILRKFSLKLNYLDQEIIGRSNDSTNTKSKASVSIHYASFKNLADMSDCFADDEHYKNIQNILDNTYSEKRDYLSNNKTLPAEISKENSVQNFTSASDVFEINSNILSFNKIENKNTALPLDGGINIDLESLEKSILELDQKLNFKEIPKLIKNKLAYLYVPPSFLENYQSPEKIMLFMKSKFVGYLDIGIEQKRHISEIIKKYYNKLVLFENLSARSIKGGFLIKLEEVFDKSNVVIKNGRNYLSKNIKTVNYSGYIAGAIVLCIGAISILNTTSADYAIDYMSARLSDARYSLFHNFGAQNPKSQYAQNSRKNLTIGRLKPLKSNENPLWIVVPATGASEKKTLSNTGSQEQQALLNPNSAFSKVSNKSNSDLLADFNSSKNQFDQSFNLGLRLMLEKDSPDRVQEGIKIIQDLANNNYPPAQSQMGKILNSGVIVKKDPLRAKRYFLQAAEADYAPAMYELGVMLSGLSSKDQQAAFNWFMKAAERGVTDGQYNLGIIYLKGLGVRQNLKEAYKWFSIAALQGDKEAMTKRDEVKSHLLLEETEEAQEFASTFKPAITDPRIF